MKKIFLFAFILITLSSCSIDIQNSSDSNRYQILQSSDSIDILLDAKTGESWIKKELGSGTDWKYKWIKNVKE